jgi:protoporphyrinogen oxidase
MKIAIIGGGITGLTAAYELSKNGHKVTVFEKESSLGGLANGFKQKNWDWSLEKSYHHLFTNDKAIIGIIKELGLSGKLIIKRPVTANLIPATRTDSAHVALLENAHLPVRDVEIAQLDSPLHLLRFPDLSMADKLRTGALAAFCKVYPFWQTLEGVTAKQFFTNVGGKKAWKIIWEPLMTGKFAHYDNTIAASWLWARVHKRTSSLCYIEGGFATLLDALEHAVKNNGGKIYVNAPVSSVKNNTFDKILFTIPTSIAYSVFPKIRDTSTQSPLSIPHLHAQTLILETDKPMLENVYWLSITDRSFPFLAVVAHTNFMDKKHYGNHHITYIGNYLPDGHPYLSMTKPQLLNIFLPFITRITPNTKYQIRNTYLFTAPFAQPVHQLHYSKRAPKLETSVKNVYLANMDSIYPWDRGTNYAVELGLRAAHAMS